MQLVFIIFGLIVVASFVTGVILTIFEKKNNKLEELTDDPRILFSVDEDKAVIVTAVEKKEEVVSMANNNDLAIAVEQDISKSVQTPVQQIAFNQVSIQPEALSNPSMNIEVKTNQNTLENENIEIGFVPFNINDEEII